MKDNSAAICIWAGPLALTCFLIASYATGFAQPYSSALSAEEVVAYYQTHLQGIRFAAMLSMFCGGLMIMFAAAISGQLQRIEGKTTPWTFLNLMGGIMGNLPFVLTGVLWSVAAFRLDRPPEITRAINDIAWFVLELPGFTAAIQFLGIIFVVLGDKSERPLYPKWVAYFNIFAFICFLPGAAAGWLVSYQFMDWNGLATYGLPGLASASWVLVMFFTTLRAYRRT